MGITGALPLSDAVLKLCNVWATAVVEGEMECLLPVVVPVLCDVSYPRQSLISTFLYDFEVSDLDTWYGEVWDLESGSDGGSFVHVGF